MKRILAVAVGFLLFSRFVFAQPAIPHPTGVYCSCGPTNTSGQGSVDPAIASKPFVQGILVRTGWNLLEPVDNQYNWSLLDVQIARAKSYGKKVALGIVNGPSAPAWLYMQGAQAAVTGPPLNDTIPYPWDPVFLAKWGEFIAALGARYDADTTVSLIHMTNSSANGFEFFLTPSGIFNWNTTGYTDDKMIASWKSVMNSFNAAFPNHYLDNDFHPVFLTGNSSNIPSDSLYEYARNSIGARYGAFSSWWSQNNTANYPAQYTDLQQSAQQTFANIQMAYNGTNNAGSFGPGGMPGALQLAIDQHFCYWEIWNQDILNPDFETVLSEASCGGSVAAREPESDALIQVFPNPAKNQVTIRLNEPSAHRILLKDVHGRLIYVSRMTHEHEVNLDVSGYQGGWYFLVCETGDGKLLWDKLLILQ